MCRSSFRRFEVDPVKALCDESELSLRNLNLSITAFDRRPLRG